MGQHTWFVKSKELFLKRKELYKKLDDFENGKIHLDEIQIIKIYKEIDYIEEYNDTEYHDLFRTSKLNEDGTYIDDVIYSREQCFEWINNPKNLVYFYNMSDSDKEKEARTEAINKINEFWLKYPNGVIYFG